jgi:hypothetical protein
MSWLMNLKPKSDNNAILNIFALNLVNFERNIQLEEAICYVSALVYLT